MARFSAGLGLAMPMLLLVLAPGAATDVQESQRVEQVVSGREDDECRATGNSSECALHALQRRTTFLRTSGPGSGEAGNGGAPVRPDFEWRDGFEGEPEEGELDDDFADSSADDEGWEEEEEEEPQPRPQDSNHASRGPEEEWEEEEGGWEEEEEDKPKLPLCHGPTGKACPLGETCVVKYDGTFSQCMDCRASRFEKYCQKLDDYMRYAAIHTCKRTCLDTKCYNDHWCLEPHVCVTDQESDWGQCVSCKSKKFWHNSCWSLDAPLRHKAQKRCHKHCRHR